MGREEFLADLRAKFPEVWSEIDEISCGLLHAEMGTFEQCSLLAYEQGRLDLVREYFRFAEEVLMSADPELENALWVSYLEGFVLGTPQHQGARELMPSALQAAFDEMRQAYDQPPFGGPKPDELAFRERFKRWWRA